jgi:hypothetical protein
MEIHIMEDLKGCNKTVGTIFGIFIMVLFVLANIPGILEHFFNNSKCKEVIIFFRVISIILYCSIIVPIMFSVFNIKGINKCYYYFLPLMYILLPFVLILINNNLKTSFIASIILVASIIMAISIYKILKKAKEVNLRYVKYSSFVISSAFAIGCSFLDLFCGIINVKFLLFCASLLLLLEIVYKKLDLERNGDTSNT